MTGALQTYARKTMIAIDTLTFRTVILDIAEADVTSGPANGVYVYGLYLEGARWDVSVSAAAVARDACARCAAVHLC